MIEFLKKHTQKIKYIFLIILVILSIFFLIRGIFFPGTNNRLGYFFLFIMFFILSIIIYFSTILLGSKK